MLHGKIHHKTFIHRSGDDLGTDHHYLFPDSDYAGQPGRGDDLVESLLCHGGSRLSAF